MSLKMLNDNNENNENIIECDLNNDTLLKKIKFLENDKIKLKDNQFLCVISEGKVIDIKEEPGLYALENTNVNKEIINEEWCNLTVKDEECEKLYVLFINKNNINQNKYHINDPIKYKNWKNGEEVDIYVKLEGYYDFKIEDTYKFLEKMIMLSSYYPKQELIERIRKYVINSIEVGINEISDEYKLDIDTLTSKSKELEVKLRQNEYDIEMFKYGVKLTYFDITNFEIAKKKFKIF